MHKMKYMGLQRKPNAAEIIIQILKRQVYRLQVKNPDLVKVDDQA